MSENQGLPLEPDGRTVPICIFVRESDYAAAKAKFGFRSATMHEANAANRIKAIELRSKGWKTAEVLVDDEVLAHLLQGSRP